MSQLLRVLVVTALAATASGCGHDPARLDGSFTAGGTIGLSPMAPGSQAVLLDAEVHNHSSASITITRVQPVGTLRAAVVSRVAIAPILSSRWNRQTVPASSYDTYPPVDGDGGKCAVQELLAPSRARLAPGQTVRVMEEIDAKADGRFHQTGVSVTYTVDGNSYSQTISSRIEGTVRAEAHKWRLPGDDIKCLKPGVRVLKGIAVPTRRDRKQ